MTSLVQCLGPNQSRCALPLLGGEWFYRCGGTSNIRIRYGVSGIMAFTYERKLGKCEAYDVRLLSSFVRGDQ